MSNLKEAIEYLRGRREYQRRADTDELGALEAIDEASLDLQLACAEVLINIEHRLSRLEARS